MFWPKLSSDTINSSQILLTGTMVEEKAERGPGHEDMRNQTASSTLDPAIARMNSRLSCLSAQILHKKSSPNVFFMEAPCLLEREYLILILLQEMGVFFFSFV